MGGKKKKPFIDKKHAVTFHLVHRSQKDPLAVDEDAPQHVLLQAAESSGATASSRRDDQIKYGIYFEDDYNYLQHLRDVDELNQVAPVEAFRVGRPAAEVLITPTTVLPGLAGAKQLVLPSSVFGSKVETDVGLLNKAVALIGPQPDLDPDVIAALDEDFDFDDPDNELEDNFIELANSGEMNKNKCNDDDDDDQWEDISNDDSDATGSDDADGGRSDDDDDDDDVGSLHRRSFDRCETKSHFTDYSMSSSVVRRNAGLTLLDDKFEKFYEQYGEGEIGALDGEDIAGCMSQNSDALRGILDAFEKEQRVVRMRDVIMKGVAMEEGEGEGDDEGETLEKMVVDIPVKERYDCESILSTRSTLYNHPKTIPNPANPIRLTKRVAIPADTLPTRGPTRKQREAAGMEDGGGEEEKAAGGRTGGPARLEGESREERRARKQEVREGRRMRREEKSAVKKAFKEEKLRQNKEMINMKLNLQSVHIV